MIKFSHQFVQHIPEKIEPGILYISLEFKTIIHSCACGCGNEIVTQISPDKWTFIFNGESVSLNPSIGNWSLPCQSHYWIKNSQVKWASKFTDYEIGQVKNQDKEDSEAYYFAKDKTLEKIDVPNIESNSIWDILKKWLRIK